MNKVYSKPSIKLRLAVTDGFLMGSPSGPPSDIIPPVVGNGKDGFFDNPQEDEENTITTHKSVWEE